METINAAISNGKWKIQHPKTTKIVKPALTIKPNPSIA